GAPGGGSIRLRVAQAPGQDREGLLHLRPGQGRPKAVVDAPAEGELRRARVTSKSSGAAPNTRGSRFAAPAKRARWVPAGTASPPTSRSASARRMITGTVGAQRITSSTAPAASSGSV